MSELAGADWPALGYLDLSINMLDAVAVQHLCRMRLPSLENLRLESAGITPQGAYWLASGHWPLLATLDFSYNYLDRKGVEHILVVSGPGCNPSRW